MATFVEQVSGTSGWPTRSGSAQTAASRKKPIQQADSSADVEGLLPRHRRSALLSRVVEAEILPRLARARAGAVPGTIARIMPAAKPEPVTTEDDTQELVRLLLGDDDGSAWIFIQTLENRGTPSTALYLGIIPEAARRLGEMWEDDRCDFTQVTISLGRLQCVVRGLSPSFQMAAVNKSAHADAIMLLPAPGEQHTLGLVILAEFFQREGWHILGGPVSTGYDAPQIVRDNWVDVVGFSIGSASGVDTLASCIQAVRRASRNRYVGVMVGGPLFRVHPEWVSRVGADTTAPDAPSALRQARGLLEMRAAAD